MVTAGNAPGLNDGAAALVVMSRAFLSQRLTPLAPDCRLYPCGSRSAMVFAAPARAIPRLLDRIDWTLDDVDLIEVE